MPHPGASGLQAAVAVMTAQICDEEEGGNLGARMFADYARETGASSMDLAMGLLSLARALLVYIEATTGTPPSELLKRIGRGAAEL